MTRLVRYIWHSFHIYLGMCVILIDKNLKLGIEWYFSLCCLNRWRDNDLIVWWVPISHLKLQQVLCSHHLRHSTFLSPTPHSDGQLLPITLSHLPDDALSLRETNRLLLSRPGFWRHYHFGLDIISWITFFSLKLECWEQKGSMQYQEPQADILSLNIGFWGNFNISLITFSFFHHKHGMNITYLIKISLGLNKPMHRKHLKWS